MTDICRLCASLKILDHLRPIDEPSLALRRKLLRCCQLELPNDADYLPQSVCDVCMQRLDSAWSFAESVTQAQETLQKAFDSVEFNRKPINGSRRSPKKEPRKVCSNFKEFLREHILNEFVHVFFRPIVLQSMSKFKVPSHHYIFRRYLLKILHRGLMSTSKQC